ncbi:MAG: bifunctional 2-C-methyl-D-erythritol 4-phosphate cytidylyltransferase/2-C-methyl-D-erythritol 2,4-cyclodiphosphate synthase [Hyphomicrobiaceae bacterium]
MPNSTTIAVVVAAGRGTRAGTDGPKQYVALDGAPVLQRSLAPFLDHPRVGRAIVVVHADDLDLYREATADLTDRLLAPAMGGDTRQASVRAGLEALSGRPPDNVLIHDAARPFVDPGTIDRVMDGLAGSVGAIPALAIHDTIKRGDAGGRIQETVERTGLFRAQTPQGFRFAAILDAHRRAAAVGIAGLTDDAHVAEWAGLDVALVAGTHANTKLTTATDLLEAENKLLRDRLFAQGETVTGSGFDVHRFTTGDHVWLCGVQVPHIRALEGHSDADAPLHALTDAILGALGEGDIGVHFPPSDPQWRGAASEIFVRHAVERVRIRGGRLVHADITIVAERPRIGAYRAAMTGRLAELLALPAAHVSIKATTSERMGFTGREEGLAALATVTVRLPFTGR